MIAKRFSYREFTKYLARVFRNFLSQVWVHAVHGAGALMKGNKSMKALMTGRRLRVVAASVIAGSVLIVTGTSIFAGLNAKVSASQSADGAGTLILLSANNGTGVDSQNIQNLAPGDVVNRYVTLTNSGTLAAQGLGLAITATGTSTLITDGTGGNTNKALTVTVNSCSGSWNTTTGVCTGTSATEIAETSLSGFSAQKNFTNSTLLASGSIKLQIQVKLPDQNETTTNGTAPAVTVQGGSVALAYVFSEAQRTATTTNS